MHRVLLRYLTVTGSDSIIARHRWRSNPAIAPRPWAVDGKVVQYQMGGRDVAPLGTDVRVSRAMPPEIAKRFLGLSLPRHPKDVRGIKSRRCSASLGTGHASHVTGPVGLHRRRVSAAAAAWLAGCLLMAGGAWAEEPGGLTDDEGVVKTEGAHRLLLPKE